MRLGDLPFLKATVLPTREKRFAKKPSLPMTFSVVICGGSFDSSYLAACVGIININKNYWCGYAQGVGSQLNIVKKQFQGEVRASGTYKTYFSSLES